MGIETQKVKMLPGSHETVHAAHGSYVPTMGTPNLVHPDDVDELLAAGWSLLHLANSAPPPPAPPVTDADLRRWFPERAGGRKLRLLIPSACDHLSVTVFGRRYSATQALVVDAPETDARALAADGGWLILGQVGTTEERPSSPKRGDRFIDTLFEAEVIFDGAAWRHSATGEEV
jgi:hypothetical protein